LHKVVNFSVKGKLLKIKSEGVGKLYLSSFLLAVIFFLPERTSAQVEKPLQAPKSTLPVRSDSLNARRSLDSLETKADTLIAKIDSTKVKPDSVKKERKHDIETTIFYSASDSINSSIDRKIVKLYGDAKIKYGQIELEADEIIIDYESSTITADAGIDTLGNKVGYPIFKNGSETYETRGMVYNFKNKRAKITEVVTKQGEGILHAERVYKNDKNELFSVGNGYTTCDLAHPHYRIVSTKTKAIPGDKMISGPFYMEFMDVPTPLGFIFGIFPSQRKSSSGIIVPTYGEERNRGFFLRNGGYFFDINDYVKLALTADLYSKGSNGVYINSTYKNRYHYSGNFSFSYTNNHTVTFIESPTISKDFRLVWSHSPQSKGSGRFSASVNAATASFTSNNYLGANINAQTASQVNNTSQKLSSNISYSKTFGASPFSMGINLRHNQDLVKKNMDISLPDISFNVNNLYPFKKVKGSMFLQNFSTRLTGMATNHITNDLGNVAKNGLDSIAPFNGANLPYFFRTAKKGVKMNVPIQTSVKVLKFFTLSPSINLDEVLYFNKLVWGIAPSGSGFVVKDTINKFNSITNYSGSVSVTTRIYGTKFFKKGNRIQAIRHIINPSVGMSFQPDFGDPKYGYFQRFDIVSSTGAHQIVYKSAHENFIYGPSRMGKSNSISFGINNNLEMKVKNKGDSVARKIPIFNTLSITSSYNFAATFQKLAPFNISGNTNVLDNKVNVSLSAIIFPYKFIKDSVTEQNGHSVIHQHANDYAWKNGFNVGQLQNLSFAFSTNLNPKGQNKDNTTRDKIAKSNMTDSDKQFLMNNPDAYVDFSIPWNLRLNYNVTYSKTGFMPSQVVQAVRVSGDVSLSKKWKIVYTTGYDFKTKEFTSTSFSLNRELHCWMMTLNWVPFGRFQSYNFTIAVKSAMLRDLKLNRTRSFFDTQ
jgi:LptD protein